MFMHCTVRVARLADAGAIAALTNQLGYEADPDGLRLRLGRMLARADQCVLLAELDGRPVGWVHVLIAEFLEADRSAIVAGLVVDAADRRRGVGRTLMAHAERWAREQGCSIVRLWSSDGRTAAHRFYEALGYAKIKTQFAFAKPLTEPPHDLGALVPQLEGISAHADEERSLARNADRVRDLDFRRAVPSDADALAEAHRDSIVSLGPAYYSPDDVRAWQDGLTRHVYLNAMEGGEVFFIATGTRQDSARVLGFASDYEIEGTSHGTSVYVRGDAARLGIGSRLLQLAEAHAIEAGATAIQIEASLAGVAFYKANGYVEVARGETRLMSGHLLASVLMRKMLRS
jgi:ribosomal protein S18 acetylase RimI-like enzyme